MSHPSQATPIEEYLDNHSHAATRQNPIDNRETDPHGLDANRQAEGTTTGESAEAAQDQQPPVGRDGSPEERLEQELDGLIELLAEEACSIPHATTNDPLEQQAAATRLEPTRPTPAIDNSVGESRDSRSVVNASCANSIWHDATSPETTPSEASPREKESYGATTLANLESLIAAEIDDSYANAIARNLAARDAAFDQDRREACKDLDLSVILSCQNQSASLGNCLLQIEYALEKMQVEAEIIVADHGSHDDSRQLAEELGARWMPCDDTQVGGAIANAVATSAGRHVLVADADDRFDFTRLHQVYSKLTEGAELVQACRLPSGGGKLIPGSMSCLHRWGNTTLSCLARQVFRLPLHDIHCSLRGFSRELYERIAPSQQGEEFAIELVVKSRLAGARVVEVPVSYRSSSTSLPRPICSTLKAGWRSVKYLAALSPRWTFLIPAAALGGSGLMGFAASWIGASVAGWSFGATTMIASTLAIQLAVQLVVLGLLAKGYLVDRCGLPEDRRVTAFRRWLRPELALAVAAALVVGGATAIAGTQPMATWEAVSRLSIQRLGIVCVGLAAIGVGVHLFFGRVFLGLLDATSKRAHQAATD
jgi:hypothetical protein